jgi:hypothetical protein
LDEVKIPESPVLECGHCGNRTPHELVMNYHAPIVYDQVDRDVWLETFTWLAYKCGTCGALSLYGDFYDIHRGSVVPHGSRLHPRASDLLPPSHMMSPADPVPGRILRLYAEIWSLRHRAPAAFIAQVRRALEYVCEDCGAEGKTLYDRLRALAESGVFPGHYGDITELLRRVGNIGAHASEEELSAYDAELIDDFFRSIIEYVYVAPAKVQRMRERLAVSDNRAS